MFPMLNVGSSTEAFRTSEQPWIDRYLFARARKHGYVVKHVDIKPARGVDLVGDLADPSFLAVLRRMAVKSVFCSNLLEHVSNRELIARALRDLVPPGGYLFVSCPYRFPYHPDPIDTMFRPTVAELAALFPGLSIQEQAVVSGGTYAALLVRQFLRDPLGLCKRFFSRPATDHPSATAGCNVESVEAQRIRSRVARLAPWLFRQFQAACVVLRKKEEGLRNEAMRLLS